MRKLSNFDIESMMRGFHVHHRTIGGEDLMIRTTNGFLSFVLSHYSDDVYKAISEQATPIAQFAT